MKLEDYEGVGGACSFTGYAQSLAQSNPVIMVLQNLAISIQADTASSLDTHHPVSFP